jgi:hypothetical protein
VNPAERRQVQSREHIGEMVSAATYGTVLVMAAIPLIDAADVGAGIGWALVTGVSAATFVAHAYAEIMGDHVRHDSPIDRKHVRRAITDGLPILLAAVVPALALGIGQTNILAAQTAVWTAFIVAVLQLVALGVFVGWAVQPRPARRWIYTAAITSLGLVAAAAKLTLSH